LKNDYLKPSAVSAMKLVKVNSFSIFQSARIRLTGWYLLIIMSISILFSAVIYVSISSRIEGLVRIQNERIRKMQEIPLEFDRQYVFPRGGPPMISTEELIKEKEQLALTLALINLTIFLVAGGGGYFLAGQTLQPIKRMVDEQNRFIGDASHELRTPIATLQAEMEGALLEGKINDRQARKLIKSNLEEIGRLKGLTDGLLRMSKAQTVYDLSVRGNIFLNDIVRTAKGRVAVLGEKKKVNITVKVEDAVLKGDKQALTEMLVILLENAVKYSPKESAVKLTGKNSGEKVFLSVVDRGVGISKEDLPYIFDRFYRADKSRSLVEGFGLGLSIAKKTIEAHGGIIRVISAPNKGSTFLVELPRVIV